MPVTALPTPPSRSDSSNFAARGDAFLGALPLFGTELNALQADVNSKQAAATNSATQAGNAAQSASGSAQAASNSAQAASDAAATAAAAAAGAIADDLAAAQEAAAAAAAAAMANWAWVSGTTYVVGDVRWSPNTRRTYRRITNGAGTTDPSNDPTNWVPTATSSLTASSFFFSTL